MNVIKKYKEKWQQENVNKNKMAVSRLRWPQDECSSTQNQGGRNGRQQWVAPVCLLPIPQSEDTCWMFSCHFCNDTLEIMSDEIQAIRLTICLSLPLRLTCCSAAQQAGCRRLGDGYARLNRLSLPLWYLLPGQNAAGVGWAQILRVGCVVAQGQQVLAQKTWRKVGSWKVRYSHIPEALEEALEVAGGHSMKRGMEVQAGCGCLEQHLSSLQVSQCRDSYISPESFRALLSICYMRQVSEDTMLI